MGIILDFRPRRAAGGSDGGAKAKPATIIIFPGVRYERRSEAEPNGKWSAPSWLPPMHPHRLT